MKEDQYNNPRNALSKVIYNSGSVRTHGKQEFLYGKLEIRAKFPKGKGVFPAFWTLGADFVLDGKISDNQGHGWPSTDEIDIMELIGDANSGSYANRLLETSMMTIIHLL
ncbi:MULTISPECIES: family 16 glycosylhydrolase [unclassified Streptococcus]|uniref:family 16 glycosylhydrolase n=1 Tax=Streptococcus sp. X16XC17 TaxID=2316646 RepID=UPI00069DED0C|nr:MULTISPECIES: family 16 glycosylhydrolase [unclassified Streptococcus]